MHCTWCTSLRWASPHDEDGDYDDDDDSDDDDDDDDDGDDDDNDNDNDDGDDGCFEEKTKNMRNKKIPHCHCPLLQTSTRGVVPTEMPFKDGR